MGGPARSLRTLNRDVKYSSDISSRQRQCRKSSSPLTMTSTINSFPDGLPQRIPAWKRLGLKLKYAKENADEPPAPQTGAGTAAAVDSIHPERLRNIDQSNESLRPSKKRKTPSDSRHSAAKPTDSQSGVPHSTENPNGSPKPQGKASFPAPQINGNGSISPRKSR